jgi:hypothetical protein
MNVNFPTRLVFAAAVEADRINGGYYKFPTSEDNLEKKKNFDIIKHLLEEKTTFTDETFSIADEIIHYYNGKLLELMSNKLNSYSVSACIASNQESVTDIKTIGLIASLPKAWRQSVNFDQQMEEREQAYKASTAFGSTGDQYIGNCEIIMCVYSTKWFRYFITAKDINTNNVVNFSMNRSLEKNKIFHIHGKVKDHVDGVTRLNYVKVKDLNSKVDNSN